MRMYEIIYKKRNGETLSKQEIDFVINSYVENKLPDYQMSALLMAIFFNGMDKTELRYFTQAMVNSGKVYDFSFLHKKKNEVCVVDKHSTGGVGDGVSLSLAPLIATTGIFVPMISGRGLGHTGGTLDKLESIPGFVVELKEEEFVNQVKTIGVAIISQSQQLVPADKKIYALRDATATVDSIPLIAASITSKKLAEGCDAIVFDVKTGNGAFMEKYEDAKLLAKTMVEIMKSCGKKALAVISDMNQPLGEYAGNSVEIFQAIKILQGEGPKDITELVLYLAAKMLLLAQKVKTHEEAVKLLKNKISSGEAIEKFRQMVKFQHGDVSIIDNPQKLFGAKYTSQIVAQKNGFVGYIDTKLIGNCLTFLGAGREKMEDKIDHSVGIKFNKKLADYVKQNEPLMEVYYNNKEKFEMVKDKLLSSYKIYPKKKKLPYKLVYEVIK